MPRDSYGGDAHRGDLLDAEPVDALACRQELHLRRRQRVLGVRQLVLRRGQGSEGGVVTDMR